jgi:hypothetical protein
VAGSAEVVVTRAIVFVGERRSATAIREGWTWTDGRLAAKPLFEALRANGIDPAQHSFVNLFSDPPGQPKVVPGVVAKLLRERSLIVTLGKVVSNELARRGIVHVPLVHPAARGAIRKRARYIAHVTDLLAPHIQRT